MRAVAPALLAVRHGTARQLSLVRGEGGFPGLIAAHLTSYADGDPTRQSRTARPRGHAALRAQRFLALVPNAMRGSVSSLPPRLDKVAVSLGQAAQFVSRALR